MLLLLSCIELPICFSKDPSLEEKLQYTLRENLKEIGQRCILDLREYMDRLREHDSPAVKLGKV